MSRLQQVAAQTREAARMVREQFGQEQEEPEEPAAQQRSPSAATRRARRRARRESGARTPRGDRIEPQEGGESAGRLQRARQRATEAASTAAERAREVGRRGQEVTQRAVERGVERTRQAGRTTIDISDRARRGTSRAARRASAATATAAERARETAQEVAERAEPEQPANGADARAEREDRDPGADIDGQRREEPGEAQMTDDTGADDTPDEPTPNGDAPDDGPRDGVEERAAREERDPGAEVDEPRREEPPSAQRQAEIQAAEQFDEQIDEVDIGPEDVIVQQERGPRQEIEVRDGIAFEARQPRFTAALTTGAQLEIAERQVAAETGLEPGEDFEVGFAGTPSEREAAFREGEQPDFEVELTAEGREELIRQQVREEGALVTEEGETVEVEEDQLEFDDEGFAQIEEHPEPEAASLADRLTDASETAFSRTVDFLEDAAVEAARGTRLANPRVAGMTDEPEDVDDLGPGQQFGLGAGIGLAGVTVGGPATLETTVEGSREAAFDARDRIVAEGPVAGLTQTAEAGASAASDVVAAAEEEPFIAAGAVAAPGPGPPVGRAPQRRPRVTRQDVATAGVVGGAATGAAVQQGEISVPEDPVVGGSEITAPDTDPTVRRPEIGVPESGEPTVREAEVTVPESGEPTVRDSELGVPETGDPTVRRPEITVPDQDIGGGAGVGAIQAAQMLEQEPEELGEQDPVWRRRRRRRRQREERREILRGPDEAVIGGGVGGGVAEQPVQRRQPRRDTVVDRGVVDAGVVGTGRAAVDQAATEPGVQQPTETGSELFDAAFGATGPTGPPGTSESLGVAVAQQPTVDQAIAPDAEERLQTAQTPAAETATAAGLRLDDDLTPGVGVDTAVGPGTAQQPLVDAAAAQQPAVIASVAQQQAVQQQALQQQATAAQPQAFPEQPGFGFGYGVGPGFGPGFGFGVATAPATAGVGVPVVLPEGGDDDRRAPARPGRGEQPFANPVVGGVEAFEVAGATTDTGQAYDLGVEADGSNLGIAFGDTNNGLL